MVWARLNQRVSGVAIEGQESPNKSHGLPPVRNQTLKRHIDVRSLSRVGAENSSGRGFVGVSAIGVTLEVGA